MKSTRNLHESLQAAASIRAIDLAGSAAQNSGSGKPSMSITNNANGYRVTFNPSMSRALKLEEKVNILPIQKLRQVLIGKAIPNDAAIQFSLRGDATGRKIIYKRALVELLTEQMAISYANGTTSRSFDDIYIEDYEGSPIAIVAIDDASAGMSIPSAE